MLTPEQRTTLVAHIRANTNPEVIIEEFITINEMECIIGLDEEGSV